MYSLIPGAVLGYLLGSVPTAYLLVRWKSQIDIRTTGSGNVGTLNSLQVTRSKAIGAAVLGIDLLKGIAAVWVARVVAGEWFLLTATAGIFAVVGHNYPVWLKFKGGRGLATAAGVFFVVSPVVIAGWVIAWTLAFFPWRKVNMANTIATVLLMTTVWLASDGLLEIILPGNADAAGFRWFVTLVLGVILTKHVDPILEMLKKQESRNRI